MHNFVDNFNQIVDLARQSQAPVDKRRGILREYLQTKFISVFYTLPNSNKMSFTGGTSLRLIRGINRFSEDLDFDNLGLSNDEIGILINEIVRRFHAEGLGVDLKATIKEAQTDTNNDDAVSKEDRAKTYFELKFPSLLEELKITTNPREKLMIKVDYASLWKGQVTELALLNKYGFIGNVVVNKIGQTMVQKLAAYVQRNTTQPRDIYDIVWLYSQGAVFDRDFARVNGLDDIVQRAVDKYKVEGVPEGFKNKLAPFLFNVDDTRKLDLLGEVLSNLT